MAKQAYVYSGTDWVPLASEVTNLSNYQLSNGVGLNKVIPTSVSVGSGSGSVDATGTITFSGASSISLNGCFTNTYDNYKILVTTSSGANVNLQIRMRASGTDNSTASSYIIQRILGTNTTLSGTRQTQSWFDTLTLNSDDNNFLDLTFFRPFLAKTTGLQANYFWTDSTGIYAVSGGYHTQATSYDGCTLFGSSTFTGTIRVYGYKN